MRTRLACPRCANGSAPAGTLRSESAGTAMPQVAIDDVEARYWKNRSAPLAREVASTGDGSAQQAGRAQETGASGDLTRAACGGRGRGGPLWLSPSLVPARVEPRVCAESASGRQADEMREEAYLELGVGKECDAGLSDLLDHLRIR